MPPQKKNEYDSHVSGSHVSLMRSKDGAKNGLEIGTCNVKTVGLENFIRTIIKEIDLNLTDDAIFNLNDRGILYKWDDVFKVENTYAQCLSISKRLYECRSYTHEPEKGLTYFILEEFNHRSYSFLPDFKFYVLIFCWYDKTTRSVTKVSVQYDQHSFFLHCFGVQHVWRWLIANILTPPALVWAKCYRASGLVNPLTFIAQIFLFIWLLSKLFS